jgi:hypothetical protein
MYDTGGSYNVCRPAPVGYELHARLRRLRAEVELAESGALARREAEEAATMMLRRPVNVAEAYGWFGLFLGLFPPAAIFSRLFLGEITSSGFEWGWLALVIFMNAVCAVVGRKTALFIAAQLGQPREQPWPLLCAVSLLAALVWGVVTGGAGGLVFFGFGAFFGALYAVAVALVAFPAFALLHRLLSRGGMIDEHTLWPLAFGLPAVVAAAILGM